MSVDQIGEKEFVRRNLWEATLLDEKHNPLVWSTGLIKSTNIPKLAFTVEDIYAGTSKGYTGWKLPDNLQIGIWETSDHQVEKYLDEWMTGKTGVLNIDPEKGVAFRTQPSEDYIYRDVKIKTFIYEYTESKPYQVKKKNVVSALFLAMLEGLQEQTGPVSIDQQEYIHAVSEIAMNEIERIVASQHESVNVQEKINASDHNFVFVDQYTPMQKIVMVEKKQVIPVLDKITAAIGGLANQAIARIPFSDLSRNLIPPVVIPPPLLRIPVATGTPTPQLPMYQGKYVRLHENILPNTKNKTIQLQDRIAESSQERTKTIRQAIDESKQKVALKIVEGIEKKVEEVLIEFASGEATHAKEWKASEKTTSLVTYSTAIEGYDIGTYDYSTGDGVSYNINLAVRDIKIEYPV
jgi:hypothetical protein